jgi:serine/threonine-protein kinase RsbW
VLLLFALGAMYFIIYYIIYYIEEHFLCFVGLKINICQRGKKLSGKKENYYEQLLEGKRIYKVKTIKQCQKKIEKIISQLKKNTCLKDEVIYELQTAANEICYNAIEHGNKFSPHKIASISYYKGESEIVILIEDQGAGFDIQDIPDPTIPENIFKARGRGIFLAQHMVDELFYSREGRRVYLIKKIKGANKEY